MSTVHNLSWDSDFFNSKVGELKILNDFTSDSEIDTENYDWIVLKQTKDITVSLKNFENTFTETKYTFSKSLVTQKPSDLNVDILDSDHHNLQPKQLYDLAYESGKYSRFKLDPNIPTEKFKELYQKWVDNSLNHKFADKVFFIEESGTIIGFVTVKKNDRFASIGLIAVSQNHQGKGYGKQLLQHAENYCISINIEELRIPTQKNNSEACSFYQKNHYYVSEELILKHYWKTHL